MQLPQELSRAIYLLLLLFLVSSCASVKIDPPGPSTQALLIIPVELDANVVSIRHSFYYIYEITKADDTSFSYDVEIKFPVAGDMLIIDSLPPGDYYVRKFTYLPIGVGAVIYGENSASRYDRFSLEFGKITIFSKSFKLTLRNRHPGRFATIIYNFDIVPVTSSQEKAILSTLKELPNFDAWIISSSNSLKTFSPAPFQPKNDCLSNSSPDSDWQASEAASDAIYAAQIASNKIGRPAYVQDLIYQADVASRIPECDNVRAKILADKAYQLAIEQAELAPDITGIYVSEITSTNHKYFSNRYRKLVINFKQDGNAISGSDETYNVDIWGTRDGDIILFTMGAHKMNDFESTSGRWVISADGSRLEGSWEIPGRNSQGQWDLERVR